MRLGVLMGRTYTGLGGCLWLVKGKGMGYRLLFLDELV